MIRRAAPIAVGLTLVAVMVWTGRPPESGVGWRVAFVAAYGTALGSLAWFLRHYRLGRRDVLVGAILLRLVALPMLPSLSDDGYRYLWDGLVSGETDRSPYAVRPSDPNLAEWHGTVLYERMNSPDYYSVYPPLSQAVFRAATVGFSGDGWVSRWWGLKGLLVLCELVGIVALLRQVRPEQAAVYAWSPLAVIEVAGQGHTEALVIGGLGLVLLSGRSRLPLFSLGAATAGLAKLYPFALLPFAWRRDGWRGVGLSVLVVFAAGLPVWSADAASHVLESLGLFYGTFDEYAAPYRLLKAAAFLAVGDAAGRAASGALAAGFAVAILAAFLSDDGTQRGMRAGLITVVVGFALTGSTLHPWYWLPPLFVVPLLQSKSLWWIASVAPAGYIGYVAPEASALATLLGWGGGAFLVLYRRDGPEGQGEIASKSAGASVVSASSQRASP